MEQIGKKTKIELTWTGNDGWILRGGGVCIATDLIMDDPIRIRKSCVSIEEFAPALDALFLSHEHSDHFHENTCLDLLEQSACLFVVPFSCAKKAEALGIPEKRRMIVRPGEHFEIKGMQVQAVRAIHGHIGGSIYEGASTGDCGYVFTIGGRRIYQPGDTVLLQEHQEQIRKIDIMFVSPTEHNTWVKQSEEAIRLIGPEHVFIQHFGTFTVTPENAFWTVGHHEELLRVLDEETRKKVCVPQEGKQYLV